MEKGVAKYYDKNPVVACLVVMVHYSCRLSVVPGYIKSQRFVECCILGLYPFSTALLVVVDGMVGFFPSHEHSFSTGKNFWADFDNSFKLTHISIPMIEMESALFN